MKVYIINNLITVNAIYLSNLITNLLRFNIHQSFISKEVDYHYFLS